MSEAAQTDEVAKAVDTLVHGAKTLALGYFLEKRTIERKGIKSIASAIAIIDATSPNGREVLLPLIDHENETVRTVVAGGLWQSHYERAVTVLTDVQDYGLTEARRLAIVIMVTHFELNPCGYDPRYPPVDKSIPWSKRPPVAPRRSPPR